MNNGLWLVFALPAWYFNAAFHFWQADELVLIPTFGVICLAFGIVLSIISRQSALILFLIPAALDEVLMLMAGVLRGQFSEDITSILLLAYLALQMIVIGYVVYRARRTWPAAAMLAAFCLSYAAAAAFVADMSFRDVWL